MSKTKISYVQKVKLMLYMDSTVTFKLLLAGAILVGVFTPVFFEEMHWRAAAAAVGGLIMLLIGLPIACIQRLRKIDEQYGEGVGDALAVWHRTAKKDAYVDLDLLAKKVRNEPEDVVDASREKSE